MLSNLKLGESIIVEAMGRQLVVVDVQTNFSSSSSLINRLLDYSKGFDDIIFIYDTMDSKDLNMFKKMKDSSFNVKALKLAKEYGFFRGFMDTGIDDKDIIEVAKYMIKNNINDSRNIKKGVFNIIDQTAESIYIPDITDSLKSNIKNRPILVGGGKNECLKEIYLLLKALNKNPEINYNYVY